MAVIRDVMPAFELFQPKTLDEALGLLDQHEDAWILAGGLDSLDWFKDRIKRPAAVVDLTTIPGLAGIQTGPDEVEIGALTRLGELVRHREIAARYSLLAEAARHVASPEIRNQATLGGNLAQDSRCPYYRAGWECYRAGGRTCYADTPDGLNREHAIFGRDRCVTVNPSDTAPALIALDATMILRNLGGERVVPAEQFFIGPAVDVTRMTILRRGDVLTAIRLPGSWAGARFYFEKVSDRRTWDFALVSAASAIQLEGRRIRDIRLAVNGVAPYPLRLRRVEDLVRGRSLDEETARMAGEAAGAGASPLGKNVFKVDLMQALVRRAVRGTEG